MRKRWLGAVGAGGLVAIAAVVALAFVATRKRVEPTRSSGVRIRATVTDARGAAAILDVPAGHRGPFPTGTPDTRCALSGTATAPLVRCERDGQWASTIASCEPYEIGLFTRRHGLTMGRTGDAYLLEVSIECLYER